MKEERIQKVMAARGICSRRAAEKLIADGRVRVNGRPVGLGDKMDPEKDLLSLDGQTLQNIRDQQQLYLMLYKPRGYLSTARDDRGRKTVMDLVADVPRRVFPVGRLDKESEGLLLLTSDGAFAQAMTHPSGGVAKLYRVTVHPRASEDQIAKLASGVLLEDGHRTMPTTVRVLAEEEGRTVLEMVLKEGRNRQIHRMCEAVGLQVARLKRSAVGPVKLGMLQPGQYRHLTDREVAMLLRGSK
ncbi:rRNA pseudouridine synthase [Ruminococcaceae bacterium OttesenSCG-928-I18]|nr:rRNA pseudouridine synthase [Ruminococcaceae bacterium OttesenSCG-928-I18]